MVSDKTCPLLGIHCKTGEESYITSSLFDMLVNRVKAFAFVWLLNRVFKQRFCLGKACVVVCFFPVWLHIYFLPKSSDQYSTNLLLQNPSKLPLLPK